MQSSDTILERLLALHPKKIDLSLGRMHGILAALGHPERRVPRVIHVAGTNGKGSTCSIIRSVLAAHGKRVHLYTSPHLVRFRERIQLAGADGHAPVDETLLAQALAHCETVNAGNPITFFEITTAAAFLLFAEHPADYLVLEVGLGGRLDATNVIDRPSAIVLTPVSLDHPEFLGDDIRGVAAEKAGILKSGVSCAVAPQSDDVLDVIRRRADECGALLSVAGEDWMAYEQQGRMVYQDAGGLLDLPLPRLPGRFQIENAGTAIAALRLLADESVSPIACELGLKTVSWPARMQRLGPGKLSALVGDSCELWLDGGHNASAGKVIADAIVSFEEKAPRPLVMIIGMINSKDADGFLESFRGLAQKVIAVTVPNEDAAVPAETLAAIARGSGLNADSADSLEDALKSVARETSGARILITGSLYFAGYVLDAHNEDDTGTSLPTTPRSE